MIPFAVVPNVTFSPPPTDRIAAVYRYLDVRVDRVDPTVTVAVVGGKKRPGLEGMPSNVVFLWRVTEEADGTAVVTIHKHTGKKEIARALIEALD